MKTLALLLFLSCVASSYASLCLYNNGKDSRYCSYGCCGGSYPTYSTVCCAYVYTTNIGMVAGSVVGAVCGLAIFIAILIVVCRRRNAIMYHNHGCEPHVTTVTTQAAPVQYTTHMAPPPYRY